MTNNSCSVKILELSRVAPPPELSLSSTAPPISLPLTFFDFLWLRFPPTQRLFFYHIPISLTSFFDTILPKLKHSLSLTLQYYLPLAGNLIWPHHSHKPFIHFSEGDGVSLTVAESDADFHHLSGDGFREVTEYHSLVPELLVSSEEKVAVIALQITLFQNKGFCIGIAGHHAVLDGKSSTSFIKSWAQLCNVQVHGGISSVQETELMPFYDRTVVVDPIGLEEIYLNAWLNLDGPNHKSLNFLSLKTAPGLIRCTVELTRQNLEKLKLCVSKKKDQNRHPFYPSSFTLTCAYLWVCAVKTKNLTDNEMKFVFSVDARSRLEPPLPKNYFGNCIVGRGTCLNRDEILGENGLIDACEVISKQIKSLEEGVLKGAEMWGLVLSNLSKDGHDENLFSIAGSPRFEVYSSDFGWGKPRKVEVVSIESTRAFSLAESRNGDRGIEIGFVGERNEMESFSTLFYEGLEVF